MDTAPKNDHTERDSATFLILGIFIFLLGIPVTVGVLWEGDMHARVITAISGAALFTVGLGMLARGVVLRRRLP